MTPENQKNLERFADRVLRDLPPRTAPRTLEARVQAELARRAALPWWRKSFAYWPMAARVGFVAVSALLVKVLLMVPAWLRVGADVAQIKATFAPELQSLHAIASLLTTFGNFLQSMIGNVPSLWLYGGAATIVALYVALFGLGAAAYRTLYTSR